MSLHANDLDRIVFETDAEPATIQLGIVIGRLLAPGDVIFLEGDLGSGKTRLAKGIVFGAVGTPPDEVVSPTFTLDNVFEGAFPVHHVDLYRISGDQIDDLGLEEAAEFGALVVEWPQGFLEPAEGPLRLVISRLEEENRRKVEVMWRRDGTWARRMKDLKPPSESSSFFFRTRE
ncbi:MAG: tRNA (adenosine(37)-N6)-threonylcarbamoyltransferase complex ATPase subunit type 1 TsaE [Pseudomonadota bacterium]